MIRAIPSNVNMVNAPSRIFVWLLRNECDKRQNSAKSVPPTTEDKDANVSNQVLTKNSCVGNALGSGMSGTDVDQPGGGAGTVDHGDESYRQCASHRTKGYGAAPPKSGRQDHLSGGCNVQWRG